MEAKYIKFKNIFIICILLIFLVSLSTAVASDLGDTNKLKSDTNTTIQTDSNDVSLEKGSGETANAELESGSDLLSASSEDDILGEGNTDELFDLINSNSSVSLDQDYAINSQIQITSDKEIDGQNYCIRATTSSNRIVKK